VKGARLKMPEGGKEYFKRGYPPEGIGGDPRGGGGRGGKGDPEMKGGGGGNPVPKKRIVFAERGKVVTEKEGVEGATSGGGYRMERGFFV